MHTGVLIVYSVAALAASLAGGSLPALARLTHTRLQVALSFVAGLMLGMALLHLIPHAFHTIGSLDRTVQLALAGFLVMFFLQRLFRYHHHHLPAHAGEEVASACECHGPEHEGDGRVSAAGPLSWVGTAVGLGVHSVMDGLALAAGVAAEPHGVGLVGFGTALAVILHKPFDAMAVTTLMHASRTSSRARGLVNLAFALITPVGVGLFALGFGGLATANPIWVGWALAICAGTFLCIACSDLLPELHFHSHDRVKLSLGLIAGLAVALLVGRFETSGHDHHPHNHSAEAGSLQHPEPAH